MTEQKTSQNNTKKEFDEGDSLIDATLRGFRRATEDDYKEGKIDKAEHDDLMAILNRPA